MALSHGTLPPSARKSHKLSVQETFLRLIQNGSKTVEGRLGKNNIRAIRVGDFIEFYTHDFPGSPLCCVAGIHSYASFEEMLHTEGLHNCLPCAQTILEGVALYHQFPMYKERESELGVVAIRIALIA